MGLYIRKDSPFYWMALEGYRDAKGNPLREKTKIRHDAPSPQIRKTNRKSAEQTYFARMAQLASGAALPGQKPPRTFAEQAAWFEAHTLPHRRGKEREAEVLPKLVAVFGRYQLAAITRELVTEHWITPRLTTPTVIEKKFRTAARTVKAGPRTVNREVDVLKAVLQSGVPTYVDPSPLWGMKRLPTTTPKRRLMTEDEERRLLAVMEPDDKALFLIGLDSLVRMGDILDLKREDHHGDRVWIADPKSGGGFAVPISKRARAALEKIPDDGTKYFFSRRRRGAKERDRRNGIRQMLERYCAMANPPIPFGRANQGLTWHWSTRRTGATRMLTRNVDLGTVQKVGRWKKPDVVLGIYHELIDEHAIAAVETVGRRRRRRNRSVNE